jgi:hypothetical protein
VTAYADDDDDDADDAAPLLLLLMPQQPLLLLPYVLLHACRYSHGRGHSATILSDL